MTASDFTRKRDPLMSDPTPTPETLTDAEVAALTPDERVYIALRDSGLDEDDAQAALDAVLPLITDAPSPEWVTPPRPDLASGLTEAEEREIVTGARTVPTPTPEAGLSEEEWAGVEDAVCMGIGLDVEIADIIAARTAALVARAEAAEAERDRLAGWKREAMPILDGLQDLGMALRLPFGERITGTAAHDGVAALRAERDEAVAAVARVKAVLAKMPECAAKRALIAALAGEA